MEITNAVYIEEDRSAINAVVDGIQLTIPTVLGNRHFDELVKQGITPFPYVTPAKTHLDKRQASVADGGYGTWQEQFEILGEQGFGAFQSHIAAVKSRHPKPV